MYRIITLLSQEYFWCSLSNFSWFLLPAAPVLQSSSPLVSSSYSWSHHQEHSSQYSLQQPWQTPLQWEVDQHLKNNSILLKNFIKYLLSGSFSRLLLLYFGWIKAEVIWWQSRHVESKIKRTFKCKNILKTDSIKDSNNFLSICVARCFNEKI